MGGGSLSLSFCSPWFWVGRSLDGSDRLCVHPELGAILKSANVVHGQLEALLLNDSTFVGDSALKRTACSLFAAAAACRYGEYDVDLLLDCLLGIDEAQLLPLLRSVPIATLKRYDQEHTHLFRPLGQSYTPYGELQRLLALVPSDGSLIDLGAGNGRVAVTAILLRPDVDFYGYEGVDGRVTLARKAVAALGGGSRTRLYRRWLGEANAFPLHQIVAEKKGLVLYMFNPFTLDTLRRVLQQLCSCAATVEFTLVLKGMAEALKEAGREWRLLRRWLSPVHSKLTGLSKKDYMVFRTVPTAPPKGWLRATSFS
eukprot:3184094-Pleurochrysis_carterae.AAC.3